MDANKSCMVKMLNIMVANINGFTVCDYVVFIVLCVNLCGVCKVISL